MTRSDVSPSIGISAGQDPLSRPVRLIYAPVAASRGSRLGLFADVAINARGGDRYASWFQFATCRLACCDAQGIPLNQGLPRRVQLWRNPSLANRPLRTHFTKNWHAHATKGTRMKTATIRVGIATTVMLGLMTAVPTASAAERPVPKENAPIATVEIKGIKVDKEASAETRRLIEANSVAAAAAANVCGSGYTISTGAWRYSTYGTTYTWTNGTSGSGYYDKPICAVFFNDTGASVS